VHRFAPGHYDLAISRFGAMFFSDPVTAFTNIAGALREGARLVVLVWQARRRNEWATAIDAALGGPARPPAPAMDPFSLGDRAATARLLERAGFRGIRFDDVREPVFYGRDSATAVEFVRSFQSTRETLASLTPADSARALQRLRDTLAAHHRGDDGIVFDSRAWMITAHRR
jgi:SAM-dependent methyltransferase